MLSFTPSPPLSSLTLLLVLFCVALFLGMRLEVLKD
ncbi:unnamed protein product [Rhodiola kirilowii]